MSRSVRLGLTMAIIVPVLGIAAVLVYVDSTRDTSDGNPVLAAVEAPAEPLLTAAGPTVVEDQATQAPASPEENPLRPIGPKASDRVTHPSSGSCSSGSCSTPARSSRSSCSSCN